MSGQVTDPATGLCSLANPEDEAMRLVVLAALYREGDGLCLTCPPESDGYRRGADLRNRASEIATVPSFFYRRSVDEWGWLILGFVAHGAPDRPIKPKAGA